MNFTSLRIVAQKIGRGFACMLIILLLVSCSSVHTTEDLVKKYQNWSEKRLFAHGEMAMNEGDYLEAIEFFQALQANYPFGKTAEQAQLDIIYAYYETDDYASTVSAAQHYVHLFPRGKHVDYAYYMKGIANFNADRSLLQKWLPISLDQRDVGSMRDSYTDFMMLIQLFPNSRYAPDARQHLVYLRNVLAKQEMNIAEYYFRRQAYVAAANRASYLVKHYQHAPQVKSALVLMVKSYNHLGEKQLAQDAKRILALNFPDVTQQHWTY